MLLTAAAAVLFALTMALATRDATRVAGEYVGTGFHLLLLPIVTALPAGSVAQAAGLTWIACDVVAAMGLVLTARGQGEVGTAFFTPVRMAGQLFLAIWVLLASAQLRGPMLPVGLVLALCLVAYTFAGGRLSQLWLGLPSLLMMVWLARPAIRSHAGHIS